MTACIVLAGGRGTRLAAEVPGLPKCLAPVAGQPFLHWQLQALRQAGLHDVVLSLGYLHEAVLRWCEAAGARTGGPLDGLRLRCVVEPQPLGTGGAVRHAMAQLGLAEVLVTNGDTLLDGALGPMLAPLQPGEALRMATVQVADRARFGGVAVAADGRVTGFTEKGAGGAGCINAGLYRLGTQALALAPAAAAFSLETDWLPALVARGALRAAALAGDFIDMGVPDDYRRLQSRMTSIDHL